MSEGLNYAPVARVNKPVCERGEFPFAAAYLDHGHIFGMVDNLVAAGGSLSAVYEPNSKVANQLLQRYPQARRVNNFTEILQSPEIKLVAAAAIPNLRGPIGIEVMQHGKDYFTDKCPFVSLQQLQDARQVAQDTGMKYSVCFSERLQNEAAEFARELIDDGIIGQVIQVLGLGPHRLSKANRPDWFFQKEQYGGILCDIGSHQAEQFLTYSGNHDAEVIMARADNFANPQTPELEDFGEFSLKGTNDCSGYFRMDWFTPNGLRTWGDGRTTILGTKGFIECRKYIDLTVSPLRDNTVYIVTDDSEEQHSVSGKIGFPFFPAFLLDCLNRTDLAMTQQHTFKAAQLSMQAQALADMKG